MVTDGVKLYESVADRVQALIEEGALRPGDRVPSVRRLHRQWSVSVSTVLEAYRLLEDRGWVDARPRSGYYVRPNPGAALQEPNITDPPRRPQRVRTDLVMRIQADINAPGAVRLGAAAPDLDLLPHRVLARKVNEVLRRHPRECHTYLTGPGYEPLRRGIARRMVDAGCSVSPADILITGGAQESLYLSLKAVTSPGDMVAVESPCYMGLLEILETLGLRAMELRTHPRHGIDLEALEAALHEEEIKACALVTNHSNPMGCLMSDDKKRALVELAAHYRIPLIEDDVYGSLPFDGPQPSAAKAYDRDGTVIYCNSFSKTISPGFRVGWMIPGRFHDGVMWLKNMISIATTSIPQLAIAAYLAEGGYDRQLRRMRNTYRENCARMVAAIGKHFPQGTRVSRPKGGHLLWVEMPRGVNAVELFEYAAEHHISVAPGVLFSASGRYDNCMRLNFALTYDERVEAAIGVLGRSCMDRLA